MPNLFSPKKKTAEIDSNPSPKQYFFTIILTDQYLQSSLVSNNGQGIQIKESSEIKHYFDRKDLLEQLDKSLQELGQESEDVTETVFTFDQNWLKDDELTDEKKVVVKELSEELSLEALGQFPLVQALAEARLMANQNDSCLLFNFKADSFDLIFLKRGQLLDVIHVGRSADDLADIQEALARAAKHLNEDGQYLPEKILLTSLALNQKELTNLQQQLMKYDWSSNPAFLKDPNIAAMESDYIIKSISLAAARILSKEKMLAVMPENKKPDQDYSQPVLAPKHKNNQEQSENPKVEEEQPASKKNEAEEFAIEGAAGVSQASSFGIAFDKNFLNRQKDLNQVPNNPQIIDEKSEKKPIRTNNFFRHFILQHKKALIFGVGGGIVALLLLFLIFAFYFSTATITVKAHEILLQRSTNITLDPDINESDFDRLLLKASLERREIEGEDVANTTGVSLAGEKAKGKVTIFNKKAEETKLGKGTVLTAEGNKEFSLIEAVTLPAATEKNSGDGLDYGKVEAEVEANEIGADYNLNKDSKFRIADYYDDEYSATAIDNFSGGSSREVRVVAEADRKELLDKLSAKLLEEASKDLTAESSNGVYYLPTGESSIVSSNYSAELGDEAESITLKLTLEVEAVKYLASDLKQLAVAVLESELPENYVFASEEPSLLSDRDSEASESSAVNIDVDISAKAKANLNSQELKEQVMGQELTLATQNLQNNNDIDQVEIYYQPRFLNLFLKKLPNNAERIMVLLDT